MSYIEIPASELKKRALTRTERDLTEVWTGAYYRHLTAAERLHGMTLEPTLRLESGSETP